MSNVHTSGSYDMAGELFEYVVYEDGTAEYTVTDSITGEALASRRLRAGWGVDNAQAWVRGTVIMRYLC